MAEQEPVHAEFEEVETCRQMLKVYFSDEELGRLGARIAQLLSDKGTQEKELDTIKAQYKSQLTAIDGEIAAVAQNLNMGYKMENVECRVVRDYDAKKVLIYRMDMDPEEFVSERHMTFEEQQRNLLFTGPEEAAEAEAEAAGEA